MSSIFLRNRPSPSQARWNRGRGHMSYFETGGNSTCVMTYSHEGFGIEDLERTDYPLHDPTIETNGGGKAAIRLAELFEVERINRGRSSLAGNR